MRHRYALVTSIIPAAAVLLALPLAAAAAKKDKPFLHPNYASLNVATIGILPWTHRQQYRDADRILPPELVQGLIATGYAVTNEAAFRSSARNAGAESLLVAAAEQYRKEFTVSPALLTEIGRLLPVDAVLAPFLDRWESETISVDVRGYSRTDIAARLTLFSTKTGELLWNGFVEGEGQGPYNDPGAGNLSRTAPTAQGQPTTALAPPPFEEVAKAWSKNLTKAFPPRPKPKPKAEDNPAGTEKTGL